MELTNGRPEIKIGLVDGPVAMDHPDLSNENIQALPGKLSGMCTMASSSACMHGTFVAGILSANTNSVAPAICPNCTLLVRPIFAETNSANGSMTSAFPEDLAAAVTDCVEAGSHVINLSAALVHAGSAEQRNLKDVLDYAARQGVIVVAAAGNQGTIGSTAITSHPWVITVVAYNLRGRPMGQSNLCRSIGRLGLGAPGEAITSLGTTGAPYTMSGTSAAAPFVSGAMALLLSEFPAATPAELKMVATQSSGQQRNTIVPPLMDAWKAYRMMSKA